jgi:hypothetical protein
MSKNIDSRIFQSDLNDLLPATLQDTVTMFIKEAADTHYTRTYLMMSMGAAAEKINSVYEIFTSFSTDLAQRRKNLRLAREDGIYLRSELRGMGWKLNESNGIPYASWKPSSFKQTTIIIVAE